MQSLHHTVEDLRDECLDCRKETVTNTASLAGEVQSLRSHMKWWGMGNMVMVVVSTLTIIFSIVAVVKNLLH